MVLSAILISKHWISVTIQSAQPYRQMRLADNQAQQIQGLQFVNMYRKAIPMHLQLTWPPH